ncbi:MAG: FHA domain-containing protein, partial [Tepidiformaceae bacterium]
MTTADGRTREYPIDLPSLVVGRADGNSIVIDDLSVARRHARLNVDSGRLFVEDLGSAEGTFIAGQRIPANTPSLVENAQDIKFGEVNVTYQAPAAGASDTNDEPGHEAPADAPLLTELPAAIRLTLSVPPQPIAAGGAPAVASLTIQNRGRVVDEVTVTVDGLPAAWIRVTRTQVKLLPGDRTEVQLVITPPRHFDSRAGDYDFSVVVTSGETGREVLASAQLHVLPFSATVLSLHPVRAKKLFTLTAENQGNATATYMLSGTDDEEALLFEFAAPTIDLAPGQQKITPARVSVKKRKLFGRATIAPFNIVATPTDRLVEQKPTIVGQLWVKPPLQPFVKPAMFTLIAAALLVAVFIYFFWPNSKGVKTANAEAAYAGVHMCDKAKQDIPTPSTAPSSSPLFAQTDPAWADIQYAKAQDPEFGPDWCGTTIEQCGCAMTSVATVMALFQDIAMPDGTDLTPKALNDWFNLQAVKTSKGWVSQGYVYGDVVWTAANQLSGEIAKAHPGARKIRFSRIGTGSDDEIRSELKAGRPVIIEVPGHWIAAIGLDGDKILINDPYYRDRKTLDFYEGKVKSDVLFEVSDDLSAVVITAPSNVRVRVTDKEGRVVGTLATTPPDQALKDAQKGIPGSSYSYRAAWRDPTCVESPPPVGAGTNQIILPGVKDDYKIEVIDAAGGPTSVAIHTYNKDGQVSVLTQDNPGPAVLTANYDPDKAQTTVNVVPGATPSPEAQPSPSGGAGVIGGGGAAGGTGANATKTPTSGTSATPSKSGTPTAQPTSTPTVAPTAAPPNNVNVACVPTYNAAPKNALVNCTATIDGTFTSTSWTVNGAAVPSGNGKTAFSTSFDKDTSAAVAVTACNSTACRTGSSTVQVAFTATPVAATPTPTPAAGTPTPTPAVPPNNAQIVCAKNGSTTNCSASFAGDYSYIDWHYGSEHQSGGSTTFSLPPNAVYPSEVYATVCNGTACQDSNHVTVAAGPPPDSVAVSCDSSEGGVSCSASVVGNYTPPLTWDVPGETPTGTSIELSNSADTSDPYTYTVSVGSVTTGGIEYGSDKPTVQSALDSAFGASVVVVTDFGAPSSYNIRFVVTATACNSGGCRASNHLYVTLSVF